MAPLCLIAGAVSPFQWDREGEDVLHCGFGDSHYHCGLVLLVGGHVGDQPRHVHPLQHLAEHHMRPIQPLGGFHGDEELAAVGVGTCKMTERGRG